MPTLLCSMARVRTSLNTLQWIGRCVTRGLQRLHPESHFSMDDTVMHFEGGRIRGVLLYWKHTLPIVRVPCEILELEDHLRVCVLSFDE